MKRGAPWARRATAMALHCAAVGACTRAPQPRVSATPTTQTPGVAGRESPFQRAPDVQQSGASQNPDAAAASPVARHASAEIGPASPPKAAQTAGVVATSTETETERWPLVRATLGWPASTRSARATRALHVFASETSTAPLGKIAAETRLLPIALRNGRDDKCSRWAVLPEGVVCAQTLAPSEEPPGGAALPLVAPDALVPGDYYVVDAAGADVYRTAADAAAGIPTGELVGRVMVRSRETQWHGALAYYVTDKGLVPTTQVHALTPSSWHGVPHPELPISWVIGERSKDRHLHLTPDGRSEVTRTLAPRTILTPIAPPQGAWVQVGPAHAPGWLAASALTTAAQLAPPPEIPSNAQWLDISLATQTLIAYEGRTPVFATLISSGKRQHPTPAGVYRIRAKAAVTPMASEAGERAQYDVSAVPWALRFGKGLYLHAAYWHDGFGHPRSHGCINLSPRDARWLFEWAQPALPRGWSELEIPDGGVWVWIHK